MVGKPFDVVYDDFSGGHFVGQVGSRQPDNTFIGYNLGTSPNDGMLMPLPADFAITASLGPLDDLSNCTLPLAIDTTRSAASRTGAITWAGDTHVYAANWSSVFQPPLTVTSAVIATAALPYSSPAYFAPQNRVLFLGNNGTSVFAYLIGAPPVLSSTGTIPAACREIIVWGEFVFADTGTGKLYFSNPSTSATWTGTDFISIPATIGPDDPHTNHMVIHQGNLWISTQAGWWVVTGIPNSTLSLRQVTTVATGTFPVSIDTSIVSAAPFPVGILNQSGLGSNGNPPLGPMFRELAGGRDRALAYASGMTAEYVPAPVDQLSRFGNYIVGGVAVIQGSVVDGDGNLPPAHTTMWVLDVRTGLWYRRRTADVTGPLIQLGINLQSAADMLVYRKQDLLGGGTDFLYGAWIGAPDMALNLDGTYASGSAQLAEHFRKTPFTVKEILCEVDYGRSSLSNLLAVGQQRSIAVSVATTGVPIEAGSDFSMTNSTSATLTHVLPDPVLTGRNFVTKRSWVRFNPTDGSDTFTATPTVTLTGVKLRRLVMRCQEAT
jgi:hypothetical protein